MRHMGANIQIQLAAFLCIGNLLMAVDVNGIVTDQDGRPLPGANIIVEGTNIGSASDSDCLLYTSPSPRDRG